MDNQFTWTDELVKEFICELLWVAGISKEKPKDFSDKGSPSEKLMSDFKASHTPAPEQKEWEIVEFVMNKSYSNFLEQPYNFILESDGKYHAVMNIVKEFSELISHPDVNINSVKRLSDNTVWAVGEDTLEGKIMSFKIYGNFIHANIGELRININLPYLQKLPPKPAPLFTTEDGKDIFQGDDCYCVRTSDWKIVPWKRVVKKGMYPGEKYFFSRDCAEEYILINTYKFSIQEIMGRLHAYFKNPVEAFEDLKQFAKSKQSTNQ